MPVQANLKRLLLLMLPQLLLGEGRETELGGQIPIGLAYKNKSIRDSGTTRCLRTEEMIERRTERKADGPQSGFLKEFSSIKVHHWFSAAFFR